MGANVCDTPRQTDPCLLLGILTTHGSDKTQQSTQSNYNTDTPHYNKILIQILHIIIQKTCSKQQPSGDNSALKNTNVRNLFMTVPKKTPCVTNRLSRAISWGTIYTTRYSVRLEKIFQNKRPFFKLNYLKNHSKFHSFMSIHCFMLTNSWF